MRRSKKKWQRRQQREFDKAAKATSPKHGHVGTIAVLNAGEGDLKLSFDKSDEQGRDRARHVVEDMLRRGYALFVQVGEQDGEPIYARAKGFDAERCEYLVVGSPGESSIALDVSREHAKADSDSEAPYGRKADGTPRKRPGRGPSRSGTLRVAAESTRAVGIARSAGG